MSITPNLGRCREMTVYLARSFDPSRESSFVFGGVTRSLRPPPPLPDDLAIATLHLLPLVYGGAIVYQQ
jgi:hypothetical protein